MQDEDHVFVQAECFEPAIDIALLIDEPVIPVRFGARVSHSGIVRRQAAAERQYLRDDVAPQIRRSRITV